MGQTEGGAARTDGLVSELFTMRPVQYSWPRGVAKNSVTKPVFWEQFADFSQEKEQTTELTKYSSVAPLRRALIVLFKAQLRERLLGIVRFRSPSFRTKKRLSPQNST